VKFGIFDHLDRPAVFDGALAPLAEHYEDRLKLVEAYDRFGFHGYFIAEHHSTPLGVAPSPSVFLSAVAQRTRRLRFGPMIYQVGLYHPIRLLEEICMLDQMSRGRVEFGVGRGISGVELGYFGIAEENAQSMFLEGFDIVMQGLTGTVMNYRGRYFSVDNAAVAIGPVQRPHPPIWYGAQSIESVVWAARHGISIGSHLPDAITRRNSDRYRAEWAALGRDATALPYIAASRHIVVAETDREALEVARRAYRVWQTNFYYLNRRTGYPRKINYPDTFDELAAAGQAVAGAPRTVLDRLYPGVEAGRINYMFCRFAFGDQTLAECRRSIELFARDVMPALAEADAAFAPQPAALP
jgi:alkanesulfonate monooxygenase SsuD/methylene tetrahydromethanopterin reductase-like flavin-dependent oxidoreductase (luciferase family)